MPLASRQLYYRSPSAPCGTIPQTLGFGCGPVSDRARDDRSGDRRRIAEKCDHGARSPNPSAGKRTLDSRSFTKRPSSRLFSRFGGWPGFVRSPGGGQRQSCVISFGSAAAKAFEAVQAADLLLRDGNFVLVVLDLVPQCRRGTAQNPADQLVSPATARRSSAGRFSRSHAHQHHQQRAIEADAQQRAGGWPDLEQREPLPRLNIQVKRVQGGRLVIAGAG